MLSITPTAKEIAMSEADKYPTLTGNGFDYSRFTDTKYYTKKEQCADREYLWSDNGCLQIAYAIQFTKENRIGPKSTSYSIKHLVEHWSRECGSYKYVCNGCSILGLSLAGYEVIHAHDSPNCLFRLRRQR